MMLVGKNYKWPIIAVLVLFGMGCGNQPNHSDSKTSDTTNLASIDSTQIQEQENDSIPLISGSCENGREVGDMEQYTIKMRVGTSPTDSISVRSDASCFEIKSCGHNILGRIKSGTIIYAQGPLKNADYSAGIAYAFPVRDSKGNICRGYLSYLNVQPISMGSN